MKKRGTIDSLETRGVRAPYCTPHTPV